MQKLSEHEKEKNRQERLLFFLRTKENEIEDQRYKKDGYQYKWAEERKKKELMTEQEYEKYCEEKEKSAQDIEQQKKEMSAKQGYDVDTQGYNFYDEMVESNVSTTNILKWAPKLLVEYARVAQHRQLHGAHEIAKCIGSDKDRIKKTRGAASVFGQQQGLWKRWIYAFGCVGETSVCHRRKGSPKVYLGYGIQ